MISFDVTVHMIVKNEDIFVGYALASVLPYVSHVIIYDTGSTDKTISMVKDQMLKVKQTNPKINIIFEEHNINNPEEIGMLRLKQVKETTTEWFLLVDGDEIWPENELIKLLQITKETSQEKIAVVNKVRECVGDVYHYLTKSFGKYKLLGKTGHYNIRLMRKMNYTIMGIYPNESYSLDNKPINFMDKLLVASEAWYLHTTHLTRSSQSRAVLGRRRRVYSKGSVLESNQLPDIMQKVKWKTRGLGFEIIAVIYDLGRLFKSYL